MKTLIIIILVFVGALACDAPGDAARSNDQADIQGEWLAHSESQNGVKKNVSYRYVFKEDNITFIDESGKEMKYSFKLDTTGNVKLIIIRPEDKLADSTPVSVAYALNGDSLTIVVAPPGLRPTEISDKNNQELIVCKRKGA